MMVDAQRAVPLLATRDLVLFPGTLAPIFVERDKGVRALEQTQQSAGLLVMASQKSPATDDPGPDELHSIGTLAKVVQLSRLLRRHPQGARGGQGEGGHRGLRLGVAALHRPIQRAGRAGLP